jgi:hypothetical protein
VTLASSRRRSGPSTGPSNSRIRQARLRRRSRVARAGGRSGRCPA